MAVQTGRMLNAFRTCWRTFCALPPSALHSARSLLKQPVRLRRIGIVAASCLVCAYTLGVLGYVLTTPEIGIRCAFTPVVNNFDKDYLYPPVNYRCTRAIQSFASAITPLKIGRSYCVD